MHEIMTNRLPILMTTVLSVLGTTTAVGKCVIDAINHHGGHHEA